MGEVRGRHQVVNDSLEERWNNNRKGDKKGLRVNDRNCCAKSFSNSSLMDGRNLIKFKTI